MTLQRIKRISRPHIKGHRRIAKPEPVRVPGGGIQNLEDPRVTECFAYFGRNPKDYKMCKRIVTLREKFPQGTFIELAIYDWLSQKQIDFTYQAWVNGGRARSGGVVPDFVLEANGRGMAWMANGDYWHNRPEVAISDVADKLALIGHWFEHVLIEVVVDLWENRIVNDRPEVFEMALLGIGLGQ